MTLMREWLEQIHVDHLRQFQTDVLACECADVDIDELDELLNEERAFLARYRDALFAEHGCLVQ